MKFWFPHRNREAPPAVTLSRRSFLIGALATPVIIRVASLMPVRALAPEELFVVTGEGGLFQIAQPSGMWVDGQFFQSGIAAAQFAKRFHDTAPATMHWWQHPQIKEQF